MAKAVISTILCLTIMTANVYLAAFLKAIPLQHIIFVFFTAGYACFANIFILRSSATVPVVPLRPRSLTPVKNSVRLLFPFTLVFSLLAPVSLLIMAPSGISTIVAPHLFLMLSQILLETIGYLAVSFFTVYVRLGVTIAFVAYRIPVIIDWYKGAVTWAQTAEAKSVPAFLPALAQAAAVLNLVFWSFALLCFLLLYCVPAVVREPQILVSKEERESNSNARAEKDS